MSYNTPLTCFKAYDVRGKLGVDLDESIAYRIGRAFGQYLLANRPDNVNNTIVIGADIRPSSTTLKHATIDGITDAGIDVIDLGMTGTEEVYFATSYYQAMGGIEITASHNPIDYNGMKLVREQSKPISQQTGLFDIQKLAQSGDFNHAPKGQVQQKLDKTAYINHLLSYIDVTNLSKPLTIIINSGNGSAGDVVDLLIDHLKNTPLHFITMHHTPDGTFPNGIPNPMIVANRQPTIDAIAQHKADLAVAFDGDFDRCFFFDENGRFIDGTYVVGVLAQAFLQKQPNTAIVYDPRNILNTEHIIKTHGGQAVISQSGHSFIKEIMRQKQAVYGGEMSAHHYFQAFNYCDSGMIPLLLVVELLCTTDQKLSQLVDKMMSDFPISGEINFRLTTTSAADLLTQLQKNAHLFGTNPTIDTLDGVSVNFINWRFNVRASNTEPLVRLNVESIGDKKLLDDKTQVLCAWIKQMGGVLADY